MNYFDLVICSHMFLKPLFLFLGIPHEMNHQRQQRKLENQQFLPSFGQSLAAIYNIELYVI